MPISDVLFLVAVVCVFVIFGVALAWGEYQTRHVVARHDRQASRGEAEIIFQRNWDEQDAPRPLVSLHKRVLTK